ncbi:MAG: iron-sulfur protein, partial [Spirochaetes bacterium]|nr:iron-sulfur protein [Spirochaetota bacterium]
MNIVLLNGSPKGSESVTLQFAMYLAAQEREHSFTVVEVAKRFRGFERDPARFNAVMEQVGGADVVLWAFPLYYLLVSSGYKRFIELIFERNRVDAFAGRYALALSTSIHFYDHTAHNYIRAVSEDL